MNKRQAAAYVRQLCSLGLGSEAVMPEVLAAVRATVPSNAGVFFWVDADFQICGAHFDFEMAAGLSRLYFEEFYNRRETEFGPGFSAAVRMQREPGGLSHYLGPRFYRSDLYHVIWRPQGLHHSVETTLRQGERCHGVLQLFRAPGERPFVDSEVATMHRFAPYLIHALTAPAETPPAYGQPCDAGLVVVDTDGRLLQASQQGRRLLFLATDGPLSPATAGRRDNRLPAKLGGLVDDLLRLWNGEARPPAAMHLCNRWGAFDIRAHPLHPMGPREERMVGIHIAHRRPLAVQLMRVMADMPLSVRQRETCLLLVAGHTYDEIARRMGTKRSTAIDQARKVYAKLDVHGRNELASRLTEAAAV